MSEREHQLEALLRALPQVETRALGPALSDTLASQLQSMVFQLEPDLFVFKEVPVQSVAQLKEKHDFLGSHGLKYVAVVTGAKKLVSIAARFISARIFSLPHCITNSLAVGLKNIEQAKNHEPKT